MRREFTLYENPNGTYTPHIFEPENTAHKERSEELARRVGAKSVYRGELRTHEQVRALNEYVQKANRTGRFESEKLDEILEENKE